MESGINSIKDVTLILNGDDPISFDISPEKKRVYYGVCDMGYPQNTYGINEFTICPKCGSEPEYIYRNYRHIGRFKCPKCGYGSPEIDYLVTEVRDNDISSRRSKVPSAIRASARKFITSITRPPSLPTCVRLASALRRSVIYCQRLNCLKTE